MPISDTLFGLFLEDINFAADAGLYAELIKNRSFEYGALAANGAQHGWKTTSGSVSFSVKADTACLNENNPSYAALSNSGSSPEGIYNTGYLDGLAITGGETYNASVFLRGTADITLSIESSDGTVYAAADIQADSAQWHKYAVTLSPSKTAAKNLRFVLRMGSGSLDVDMVSLMPADTFGGLPVRKDLGEALAALNPGFLRFPGGCVIEGKSEESMYNWKDSIGNGIPFTVNGESAVGDPAARPQVIDIWSGSGANPYYCTYGLGFYEYFRLCEALDCLPVPVLNAGMTCQVQSPQYIVYPLNSAKFKQCVQDALDLVEFCRGGASTVWGAVRIAMGHPEPFELKYVAIGNEQWQSEYHAHFEAFVAAFEAAARKDPAMYGDIELIVANGTASGSREGWTYIEDYPDDITTLVDEHYYESPDWFLSNTHRYDSYDRDLGAKVFLGEYAAQSNTMNAALAEAAYMTALERNADIVEMACYAPLFGNGTQNQWLPDMIFFSNNSHYLTPNYYVQQLFANNTGGAYLQSQLNIKAESRESSLSGGVGLGSWMTSVAYDDLKVVSNADGAVLYENSFDEALGKEWNEHEGSWAVKDGRLVQSGTGAPADDRTGDAVYVGETDWTDYTLTVDAEILGGAEGFLIPICFQNTANHIFWNIGGWGNTVSCLQIVAGGAKSGQITGTIRNVNLKKNTVYHLKVCVSGNNVKCYINDILYVDYTQQTVEPLYSSVVRDQNGDLIIKLVNVTGDSMPITVNIPGLTGSYAAEAQVTTLRAEDGGAVNSFSKKDTIAPESSTLTVSDSFTAEALPYSLTVIRIPKK